MSDSDSDDCYVLPEPEPGTKDSWESDRLAIVEEGSSKNSTIEDNASQTVSEKPSTDKATGNESDNETIDLCFKKKKKSQNVSMSTYISRPATNGENSGSLKPQLEQLNSKGTVPMVCRESKRRRVDQGRQGVSVNKVDSLKICTLAKAGRSIAEMSDLFKVSKHCIQQIISNKSSPPTSPTRAPQKKRGGQQYPQADRTCLTALRSEPAPTVEPSEIRNKLVELEVKQGRRKSVTCQNQDASSKENVILVCRYCPCGVIKFTDPEEMKLHLDKKCMGVLKKIQTLQRDKRDCTSQQLESLNSHFTKKNAGDFVCTHCCKNVECHGDCTITIGKFLHLEMHHPDIKWDVKRIIASADIQRIITDNSTPLLSRTKSLPTDKVTDKATSNTLQRLMSSPPSQSDNPEQRWQKPSSNLPKFKRTISNGTSSEKLRTMQKRRASSSGDEERRSKRPSLSPTSSSTESTPDDDLSPNKVKKTTADKDAPLVSKRDLQRIESEDFVKRQFELSSEGQMKKQKCRHCVSYFKNSLPTLQTHLRDKCIEFAATRKKSAEKRKALHSGSRKKNESRHKSAQPNPAAGKSKGKERAQRKSSSHTASSTDEERRRHRTSTDEDVDVDVIAAADQEEERENTLGKEQSQKIVIFKLIKELISEGLLPDLDQSPCTECSRGLMELVTCDQPHGDMWEWTCNKCSNKIPVRRDSAISNSAVMSLEAFARLYKHYKSEASVEAVSTSLCVPAPEVKVIFDNLHKEVAAGKTKVKPEVWESSEVPLCAPTVQPEAAQPEAYHNKPFEYGPPLGGVKKEPVDPADMQAFKEDPDGKTCEVHLLTLYNYSEKDRCNKVALLGHAHNLCKKHDNGVRLMESRKLINFKTSSKPRVVQIKPPTSAPNDTDDGDDLPAPFDEDVDDNQAGSSGHVAEVEHGNHDNQAGSSGHVAEVEHGNHDNLAVSSGHVAEVEHGNQETPGDGDHEGDGGESGGNEGDMLVINENAAEEEGGEEEEEVGGGEEDEGFTFMSAPIQLSAVDPLQEAVRNPSSPPSTTSAGSQYERVPSVTEEEKDSKSPVNVMFRDDTVLEFDIRDWQKKILLNNPKFKDVPATVLRMTNKIKEHCVDRTVGEIVNIFWRRTLKLHTKQHMGIIGYLLLLNYIEMRLLVVPDKKRLGHEPEVDRALRKLDIFTLLLLQWFSVRPLNSSYGLQTSLRLCRVLYSRIGELEEEEKTKVSDILTSSYDRLASHAIFELRSTAHEQRNTLAMVAVEKVLLHMFTGLQPFGKMRLINQYLGHVTCLKEDNLWPDAEELGKYHVRSPLHSIVGDVYHSSLKSTNTIMPTLLKEFSANLTTVEREMFVKQLEESGLVTQPMVSRPVSGTVGEVSSSEDAVTVETASSAVQCDLDSEFWVPNMDDSLLGADLSAAHLSTNPQLFMHFLLGYGQLEKRNDKYKKENNLLLNKLEVDLRRRQALKEELEERESMIKRKRCQLLELQDNNG